MADTDLKSKIAEQAAEPKSATVDGVTVTQRSVREQIDADRYVKGENSRGKGGIGISFFRFRSGQAGGD